jgi:ATP synthase protein I
MAAPDDNEEALRARLDKLSGALRKRRGSASGPAQGGGEDSRDGFGSAMSLGLRAASEFAAAIVVGGLMGWQLDRWLGTKPAFLIAFFLIGVVAGVWNVIRVTSPLSRAGAPVKDGPKSGAPAGGLPKSPEGVDDDED